MDYLHSPVSESSEIKANALLSWEYRPGSMFYLLSETVFQGDENGEFHYPDFGFYAKLTWYMAI